METAVAWSQIMKSKPDLDEDELRSLVRLLLFEQEDWLAEKLRKREDEELVLEFLGYLGTQSALRILLQVLKDREEPLQLCAAASLRHFQGQVLLEPLTQMFLQQQKGAAKAGEVLLAVGTQAMDRLWEAWFSQGILPGAQLGILSLMAEAGDPRTEKLAFLALNTDSTEHRKAGLNAVEAMKLHRLWGAVAGLLIDSHWSIRGKAAKVLGLLGVAEAGSYLEEMPSDEDVWVEEMRLQSLEMLKAKP